MEATEAAGLETGLDEAGEGSSKIDAADTVGFEDGFAGFYVKDGRSVDLGRSGGRSRCGNCSGRFIED